MSVIEGRRPRIAITLGDLSGIGPELVAKLLADPQNRAKADIHLIASEEEIAGDSRAAGVEVPVAELPSAVAIRLVRGEFQDRFVPIGEVSKVAGERSLADLRAAIAMYQRDEVDAILFAPLNKSALTLAGMHEEDDLRWFATTLNYTGTTTELGARHRRQGRRHNGSDPMRFRHPALAGHPADIDTDTSRLRPRRGRSAKPR